PGRRAADHLRVIAIANGVGNRRVDQGVDWGGLGDAAGQRGGKFSLGMGQRLGLGAALLTDPQGLPLNEPAHGPAPAGIAWLRAMLRGLAAEGRTVLVASHVLGEVMQTVDNVVIVSAGQLRFAGPLDEIGRTGAELESAFLELTAMVS